MLSLGFGPALGLGLSLSGSRGCVEARQAGGLVGFLSQDFGFLPGLQGAGQGRRVEPERFDLGPQDRQQGRRGLGPVPGLSERELGLRPSLQSASKPAGFLGGLAAGFQGRLRRSEHRRYLARRGHGSGGHAKGIARLAEGTDGCRQAVGGCRPTVADLLPLGKSLARCRRPFGQAL